MSVVNQDLPQLLNEAKEATGVEKNMSLMQALRTYPKAVVFSMVLSTAIIMEGYDVVLLAQLYASPAFAKRYGVATGDPKTPYQIPARWQTGLSNGANVGEILGLFINGIVSERYGYRKTMIVSLVCVIAFIFIPFFAKSLVDLEVGEILCGIPWGVFQTLTTAYASEVCPTQLRAYLTTYVNLCWVIGQLIASGVLRAEALRNSQWAYRIPFVRAPSIPSASGPKCLRAAFLISAETLIKLKHTYMVILGCPMDLACSNYNWSSPCSRISLVCILASNCLQILIVIEHRWLIRRGRNEDAKKALIKLTSAKNADESFNVDDTIAMMVTTNELEKAIETGTSYWDCFKGTDLRRTEIVSVTWLIQNLCGSAFMGYSTYFLEQAGLAAVDSFDMAMGQVRFAFPLAIEKNTQHMNSTRSESVER
jgi:SP family general alpha glucoside:H+ symporter-like MFS transporter